MLRLNENLTSKIVSKLFPTENNLEKRKELYG